MLIFRKNISDVTRCDSTRSRLGTETCKTYMHIVAPVCHHQHTADHKSLGTTPTSPEHHLQDGGHFRALWGGGCIFQEVTARQPVQTFCQSRVLCPHRNGHSACSDTMSRAHVRLFSSYILQVARNEGRLFLWRTGQRRPPGRRPLKGSSRAPACPALADSTRPCPPPRRVRFAPARTHPQHLCSLATLICT